MNPNQPDPNNPNSPNPVTPDLSYTPPQPDLTSEPSIPSAPTTPEPTPVQSELTPATPPAPVSTPMPDLSAQTPLQTPSTAPSFDPLPLPAADFSQTPPGSPSPLGGSPALEPQIPSAPITPSVDFNFSSPSSSPAPIEGGAQPPAADPTGAGFTWPSATSPAQAPETPGVPQPGLSDLATTPSGSAPLEDQPPLNPLTPDSLSEPAPSDLSHLVNPAQEPAPAYTAPTAVPQPETLVPSMANGTAEVSNLPVEGNHGGIPKWVIGVGAALLLVVVAASAYFILGIGRNTPPPESAPATTEQPASPPVVQTQPIPTIAGATSSAGFGTLPGGGGTQATSAADLLRLRQGQ